MREIIVKCERHPDRVATEVRIQVDGEQPVSVDLCNDCLAPLAELATLGRPISEPTQPLKYDRTLTARIRNVPIPPS